MKTRYVLLALLPILLLPLFMLGCDSASNPIAPPGSVITVSANPTTIALTGESSTLVITGFRPDGNPLNPGSQLTLSTSLGVLSASVVEIDENGRATATLRGDGRQGTATVTVSLTTGTETTTTVDVQIGNDATSQPTLTVDANPVDLAVGETSTITVTAKNADNSPLTTGTVNIRTTLGTLASTSLNLANGNNGVVGTTLTSSQSGTATVTASVGSSEDATVDVSFGTTRKPVVTLTANPSSVEEGEVSVVSVTARDENGNLLTGSAVAIMTADRGFLSGGSYDSNAEELTLSNGRGTVNFTATGPPGEGEVTAFVQNSDISSETITVRGVPANLSLSFTGSIPSSGAGTINLTATVTNEDSIRLADQSVNFTAFCDIVQTDRDLGGNFNPNPAFTNTNGAATSAVTLNVDSFPASCGDNPQNVIIRASAGQDADGNEVIDTVTVEIAGAGGT